MVDFWFELSFEPPVVRPGETFSIRIRNLPHPGRFTHVWLELARVGWSETEWFWSSGGEASIQGQEIHVELPKLDVPPGIYLPSQVRFSLGPGADSTNVIDARPRRNFERVVLPVLARPQGAAPLAVIEQRVQLIEVAREDLFRRGFDADPANPGIGRFRGFAFVTRCLITRRVRLGQVEVLPLQTGLQSQEQAAVINQVLQEMGSRPIIDVTGRWAQASQRAFPLMLIHFPLVRAIDKNQAASAVERYSAAVIDVLSPNRISYGDPIAFVVESLDFPTRRWVRAAFEGYRGNLLGGFLSGEDPETLRLHVENVLADSMLHLFVSLFREAAGEPNLDFAYFRFWNLLEAIAVRRVPADPRTFIATMSGQPIVSANGNPIQLEGAKARVHALIKKHFQAIGLAENFLLSGLSLQDLWSVCGVWYGYRNATAHYGGFNPTSAEQAAQRWFALTNQAHQEVVTGIGHRALSSDSYLRALSETARLIVMKEVEKGGP